MSLKHVSIGFYLSLTALGCSVQTAEPEGEEVTAIDDALSAAAYVGDYTPSGGSEFFDFDAVKVVRSGRKLTIQIGYESYWIDSVEADLTRTSSGAYVFTTGDLNGECDDPGCSYINRFSGVVYTKRVGGVDRAAVKLTLTRVYPFPESDEDPSGDVTETWRGLKRR